MKWSAFIKNLFQPSLPPSDFWVALLQIRNDLFEDQLLDYLRQHRHRGHLFESFRILDCWLDVAIEQGWLDDEDE